MILGRHANKFYEQDLNELMSRLTSMVGLVAKILKVADAALDNPSVDLSGDAKTIDQEINEHNFSVEDLITEIIAKHDVFADELRFILSSIKISTYFERMGDLAKSTVKRIAKYGTAIPEEILSGLKEMIQMNLGLLDSLVKNMEVVDESVTQKIWESDDSLDDKYSVVFKKIQAEMVKDSTLVKSYTHLLLISRNLERVGDYTGSIAKIMFYVKSGKAVTKSLAKILSRKDDIVA